MKYEIVDLEENDTDRIGQIAKFLYQCFRKNAPEWLPNLESCNEEIQKSFQADRCSRVLIDRDGNALGWITWTCGRVN